MVEKEKDYVKWKRKDKNNRFKYIKLETFGVIKHHEQTEIWKHIYKISTKQNTWFLLKSSYRIMGKV